MKNYLLANFRLHNFKVWATGSLQMFTNPCEFASHLCKKIKINCFLYKFLGKITSPQTVFSQFPIFVTIWPSLLDKRVGRLLNHTFWPLGNFSYFTRSYRYLLTVRHWEKKSFFFFFYIRSKIDPHCWPGCTIAHECTHV